MPPQCPPARAAKDCACKPVCPFGGDCDQGAGCQCAAVAAQDGPPPGLAPKPAGKRCPCSRECRCDGCATGHATPCACRQDVPAGGPPPPPAPPFAPPAFRPAPAPLVRGGFGGCRGGG